MGLQPLPLADLLVVWLPPLQPQASGPDRGLEGSLTIHKEMIFTS
jgi:hypothetical protein